MFATRPENLPTESEIVIVFALTEEILPDNDLTVKSETCALYTYDVVSESVPLVLYLRYRKRPVAASVELYVVVFVVVIIAVLLI